VAGGGWRWLLKDGRLKGGRLGMAVKRRRLTGLQESGWLLYGNKLRTDKVWH